MPRQQRGTTAKPTAPLLRTCQTCFKAKIRCDRAEDSGPCDRCLRLGKTCIFSPARRPNVVRSQSRIDQLETKLNRIISNTALRQEDELEGSDSGECSARHALGGSDNFSNAGTPQPPLRLLFSAEVYDPITCGLLDLDRAEQLLNLFRAKMSPHFPFVMLSDTVTLQSLRHQRQCLYLAVLAVASFEDFILQRKLSSIFNEALAARVSSTKLLSIDVLQGLLLHLAWAHYQPRPRIYSQHLHLATSIVSDFRLDRPRTLRLWKVDFQNEERSTEWTSDELRALIGTYYLASCSAIVLQKMRHFPYAHFILDSCEKLELQGEFPTDKYLKPIVQMQRLSEEVDDIVTEATAKSSMDEVHVKISAIRNQVDSFKSSLSFALGECPTLLLQLSMLELFISQQSLPGFPLALSAAFQQTPGGTQTIDSFSESVLASKSLINFFLAMPPGQERVLSNLGWIIFSCSLSFSVRFDILMASARMSHLTKHLRRCLDIRHILRQVILRLESVVSPEVDSNDDRDAFYHFLRRAQATEAWYLRQLGSIADPQSVDESSGTESTASAIIDGAFEGDSCDFNDISSLGFFTEELQSQDFWTMPTFDQL